MENIVKIMELSKSRIKEFEETGNQWYKWHSTYIEWIQDEFDEVKLELKEKNSIYLEDELWDLFWDYICLLYSLENEWKIETKKVFERSYNKFSERIWAVRKSIPNQDNIWLKIKNKQKKEMLDEHNKKYWE